MHVLIILKTSKCKIGTRREAIGNSKIAPFKRFKTFKALRSVRVVKLRTERIKSSIACPETVEGFKVRFGKNFHVSGITETWK